MESHTVNTTAAVKSAVCLNDSSNDGKKYLEVAISGTVCLLALSLPTLMFQIVYLWKRKSTLLLRLFSYITFAAILINGTYALYLLDAIVNGCWTLYLICVTRYFLYLELFLVLSINVTVLSIAYHQIMGCCALYAWTKQKWVNNHPKINEGMFLFLHFLLPLPLLLAELEATIRNVQRYYVLYTITVYIYLPIIIIDLLLTVICTAVLMVGLVILVRKKTLNNRKMRLVYRELVFLVWFQVFVILWTAAELIDVATIINSYTEKDSHHFPSFFAPIVQALAPVSFFVYIGTIIKQQKMKITRLGKKNIYLQKTIIKSARVSLPTDTAAHVPNFLSPSTATPSSEVSPLLGHNITNSTKC